MRYVATGRVHPERADVTMLPPIVWTGSDGFKITLSCESSQLTVVLDDPPVDGFVAAFLEAKQWARAAVSALSFALGTGYTVELIQLVEESGAVRVFGVRTEELMFAPHEPIFSASIRLSAQDVFFRMALVDYARAEAASSSEKSRTPPPGVMPSALMTATSACRLRIASTDRGPVVSKDVARRRPPITITPMPALPTSSCDVECTGDHRKVTVHEALGERVGGGPVGEEHAHAVVYQSRRALGDEALLTAITALADLELFLEGRVTLHCAGA